MILRALFPLFLLLDLIPGVVVKFVFVAQVLQGSATLEVCFRDQEVRQ